ncbi:hypothetical protein BH23CHL2_BH23CHL2_06430 [soil metagenome]
MNMPVNRQRITWISHRGITSRAVENTRIAFQDAVAAGFDMLETDLRATRDGVIVLAHDDDLSQISDSTRRISDLNYDELAEINLRDDQHIYRFDEFVSEFSRQRWFLDIKPETSVQVVDVLAAWMEDREFAARMRGMTRTLYWSSREERYGRQRLPGVMTTPRWYENYRAGLASICGLPWLGGIQQGRTYGLPPTFKGMNLFTPRIFSAYHDRGAYVLAYLPGSEEEIDRALRVGADEIMLEFAYEGIGASAQRRSR